MHHLQIFLFWNSKFEDSPFLSQLTKERVIYLKRKLCIVANECSFDTGRISVMRARVIKRVRPILYGAPCITKMDISFKRALLNKCLDTKLVSALRTHKDVTPTTEIDAPGTRCLAKLREIFLEKNAL